MRVIPSFDRFQFEVDHPSKKAASIIWAVISLGFIYRILPDFSRRDAERAELIFCNTKPKDECQFHWRNPESGSPLFSVEHQLKTGVGSLVLPIPKGLKLSAQGCEERATLGEKKESPQP
jgi:hypothetical protein